MAVNFTYLSVLLEGSDARHFASLDREEHDTNNYTYLPQVLSLCTWRAAKPLSISVTALSLVRSLQIPPVHLASVPHHSK